MTQKPDNQPAFPVSTIDGATNAGMSLRDYFAAAALHGLTAMAPYGYDERYTEAAKTAYSYADAMLEARVK